MLTGAPGADPLTGARPLRDAWAWSVLPASALTPKYANPLVRAIDFAPPVPTRRLVIAARHGFPRAAAIRAVAGAIAKLDLPIEAVRDV